MKEAMRTRVMVAALCLGLLTASLVYMFLSKQAKEAQSIVSVVTARQTIPNGTIVEPQMLEITGVPKNIIPPGTIVNPEAAVGKVTTRKIDKAEPVSITAISSPNRLAYIVPPFMRAVTVAIDPVIGVAGFLKPGDHVDVLATFIVNDGTVTTTVLQNVPLLATGQHVDQQPTDDHDKTTKPSVISNATLAVSLSDAEKLVLADTRGKIRLVLRSPNDSSYFRTANVTGHELMGVVPSDTPSLQIQTPPEPKPAVTSDDMAKQVASIVLKELQKSQKQSIEPAGESRVVTAGQTSTQTQPVADKIQVIRGTSTQEITVPN